MRRPAVPRCQESLPAGDHRPTDQAVRLKQELFAAVDAELSKLRQVFTEELPASTRRYAGWRSPP